MKRPQSPLLKNERGQSLVEFGLVLPIMLMGVCERVDAVLARPSRRA